MLPINKEQWLEWASHPVTLLQKEVTVERLSELKDSVIVSDDPDYDRLVKGMVRAFYEQLEWKPELTPEEEEEDEIPARDAGSSSSY